VLVSRVLHDHVEQRHEHVRQLLLDVDVERHARKCFEHFGQRGELVQLRVLPLATPTLDRREADHVDRVRHAIEALAGQVVTDDDMAIHAHPHVQLEHVTALLQRGSKGGQRVLGVFGRRAAVGEQERTICRKAFHTSQHTR
jgi:hypothetical protein